jgi:fimbrial chaperone protein
MKYATRNPSGRAAALLIALGMSCAAGAGEFSVTPIRAELKAGALNETITITNHGQERLRVSVKLMEWTQDETGKDVYKESSDLVYFPRQLEVPPEAKRLVRVGAKVPSGVQERTYRLFIEEEPEAAASVNRPQVSFHFRFGVPVFLPPAVPKPEPQVMEPTLQKGRLAVGVRNGGNQHFRLTKVSVSDGAGHLQELAGWYSLAGSIRTYSAEIPADVCRRAKVLSISLEGEGLRFDRTINVDPASCA